MPSSGSGTGTPVTGALSSFEANPFPTAVWLWDNSASAYVNNTLEAQSAGGTAFATFGEASDFLYIGAESRFDLVYYDLNVVGNVGARTHQYYTQSGWTTFIPGITYDWSIDGAEIYDNLSNWATLAFSSTVPHAATPPDTRGRYWIRISVASVTTVPTVDQIRIRPYTAYCTASDVARLLQLQSDFSELTTPTRQAVEDYIHAAQSYIDYRTQKSWRLNIRQNEEHEFNLAGIKLQRRDIVAVTNLEVWNGSEYEVKRQGRNLDYFFIPDMGMVYFSRYFILPARLQSYNAPVWLWGWAEFSYPVRITYVYGRNRYTDDEQGGIAFDIARKLAAIEVITAHDYSLLTVSGVDKVSLREKAEMWRIDTEERLESLKSWVVF